MHLLNELMMPFSDLLQCSILILQTRRARKDGSCSEPQASMSQCQGYLCSCKTLDSAHLKPNQKPHLLFSFPLLLFQNEEVSNQTQTLCSCCSCLEVRSHPMACFPPLPLSVSRELHFPGMGLCHFPGPVVSHHWGRLSKSVSLPPGPMLTPLSYLSYSLLSVYASQATLHPPRSFPPRGFATAVPLVDRVGGRRRGLLLFLERHGLQKEMDLVLYQWAGL